MSPRLPSGALLAVTVAAAAAAVTAAVPASAAIVMHAAPAGPTAKADKIRHSEWWLSSLHVSQAWQSSRGTGVTVALLSTGVLTSHPDLTGSVSTGPDYTGSGETSASTTWGIEGTSAASIIAGHGDNTGEASGIIGVAPAARILSVRVAFDAADSLNAEASAVGRLPDAIAEGIRYAVAQGAKVIDLPLDPSTLASDGAATGGLSAAAGGSSEERSAVSYALSKGVVLVAPAGDNGDDGNTDTFPASYPGVIAAGAVDKHGNQAIFSTREPYVALTAPGAQVTTASRVGGYRNMSTTDASSAMVTGIAALIRSKYPALTVSQVRQALLKSSTRSASAPSVQAGSGAGTVDALKAMQAAAAIASPQPAAPPSTRVSAPATAGAVAPITARPRPSTVGMAKSALRDAAAAAGALIVLLLGVLLGLRLWRRRSGQEAQAAPEQPRTLLDARLGPPSGPQPIVASSARHARAEEEFAFAPAAAGMAAGPRGTDRGPDSMSPRFAPPAVMPMDPDDLDDLLRRTAAPSPTSPLAPPATGAVETAAGPAGPAGPTGPAGSAGPEEPGAGRNRSRKSRAGRSGAARAVNRSQEDVPGGPPWAPAPAPPSDLLPEPRSRPPDPFSWAVRPTPVPPAPWDTAGSAPVLGPAAGPRTEPPSEPPGGPGLPHRDPGMTGAGDPLTPFTPPTPPAPSFTPSAPPPAAGGPPVAWRPVPPVGTPLPGVPAPPGGRAGPPMGIPTPPAGMPAPPAATPPAASTPPAGFPAAAGFTPPAPSTPPAGFPGSAGFSPPAPPGGFPAPPGSTPAGATPPTGFAAPLPPPAGFTSPAAPTPPPAQAAGPAAGGPVSSGHSPTPASVDPLGLPGQPGQPRPISPRDRLPLEEPGVPGLASPPAPPASPPSKPSPPPAWRIPGIGSRYPGAGEGPAPAAPADPSWPREGLPGRTGRLNRPGEFLSPYAGRPAPGTEPEPAPAPPEPASPAEPSGVWTDESPSGPMYIWNPSALTEPFPSDPASSSGPATPPDDDPGPHRHRA